MFAKTTINWSVPRNKHRRTKRSSGFLDGSSGARILLKACMDKSIVAGLPVTGEVNAGGETETDVVTYVLTSCP